LQRVLLICGVLNIPLEEWLTIGAVFIKLYLVQYYNCLAMDCYRTDINAETTILPRMQLGRGLFLASSLVNHSCNANVYQVMYGTSSVFRARRPIKNGEQITFCYSIPATFSSYEERQMTLWNEYKFICR
jgi:SET domain